MVTFESSRLSRSHLEGQIIINQLTTYGITIHSTTEGILNSNEEISSLINSIRFYSNQMSSKHTSDRIRSSKQLLAQQGKWLGNNLPLGMTIDKENRIIPIEDYKPIIIDLFKTYAKYGSKATLKPLEEALGNYIYHMI